VARTKGISSFRVTVISAGIPEPLSEDSIYTQYFRVYSLDSNVGNIYVGDVLVDSQYEPISSSSSFDFTVHGQNEVWWDLSKFYLDSDNDGSVGIITYEKWED